MESATRLGFTPQDVAALSSITEGPVLLAGGPELVREAAAAGTTIVHEPDITVGATNAADVVAAVRFAADFRLRLAVMAPGDPTATPARGGVLVTTVRMNRIHLDRVSRTAIAEAGALWSDVVDRAGELGLAPLVPPYPRVGIVGRCFGWTAGQVSAIDVVAPDGRLRHVTPTHDPHLFQQLRNSDPSEVERGVITAMTFALFR